LESFEKVKKNWSHELERASSHCYEHIRHQGERRSEKPTVHRREIHPLRCWDHTAWVSNWAL